VTDRSNGSGCTDAGPISRCDLNRYAPIGGIHDCGDMTRRNWGTAELQLLLQKRQQHPNQDRTFVLWHLWKIRNEGEEV
jgi:hypothetical protein